MKPEMKLFVKNFVTPKLDGIRPRNIWKSVYHNKSVRVTKTE